MTLNKIENSEATFIERFGSKLQVPNKYKKAGLIMASIGLIGIIILKLGLVNIDSREMGEFDTSKFLLTHILLIGLLIISISREIIEDEMVIKLRSQAYALSFVLGVLYALIQPWVNFGVAKILSSDPSTVGIGYLQVLIFMLFIQIMFFEVLKRSR